MKTVPFLRWAALTAVLALSLFPSPSDAGERLTVAVSVLPQKYFVEAIGGDRVAVTVMVPPGTSPEIYEPKPSQMTALAAARLYFAIGVPFETTWLPRFAALSKNLRIEPMHRDLHRPETTVTNHGNHGHAAGDDPHLWTSPPIVRVMAGAILQALIEADPDHGAEYLANHARFAKDIDALDTRLLDLFTDVPPAKRRFLVVHPAWSHFARAYGLTQIAIEADGKEPGPRALAETIAAAQRDGIRTVFVQSEFPTRNATVIAKALGARLVPITPLAADWPANLLTVGHHIKDSLP